MATKDRIVYQDYTAPFFSEAPYVEILWWEPTFPVMVRGQSTLHVSIQPYMDATKTYLIIALTGNKLIAPINLGETWAEHFASRGWDNIQEQVDAGYPLYAQPVPQTGDYKEVIDYGAVFNNVIANIDFSTAPIYGTVHVSCSLRHSVDGLTWSAPVVATSLFIQEFRFIEVTIVFEAVN